MSEKWHFLVLAFKATLTALLLLAAIFAAQAKLSETEERLKVKGRVVFPESQRAFAVLGAIILIGLIWIIPLISN